MNKPKTHAVIESKIILDSKKYCAANFPGLLDQLADEKLDTYNNRGIEVEEVTDDNLLIDSITVDQITSPEPGNEYKGLTDLSVNFKANSPWGEDLVYTFKDTENDYKVLYRNDNDDNSLRAIIVQRSELDEDNRSLVNFVEVMDFVNHIGLKVTVKTS